MVDDVELYASLSVSFQKDYSSGLYSYSKQYDMPCNFMAAVMSVKCKDDLIPGSSTHTHTHICMYIYIPLYVRLCGEVSCV